MAGGSGCGHHRTPGGPAVGPARGSGHQDGRAGHVQRSPALAARPVYCPRLDAPGCPRPCARAPCPWRRIAVDASLQYRRDHPRSQALDWPQTWLARRLSGYGGYCPDGRRMARREPLGVAAGIYMATAGQTCAPPCPSGGGARATRGGDATVGVAGVVTAGVVARRGSQPRVSDARRRRPIQPRPPATAAAASAATGGASGLRRRASPPPPPPGTPGRPSRRPPPPPPRCPPVATTAPPQSVSGGSDRALTTGSAPPAPGVEPGCWRPTSAGSSGAASRGGPGLRRKFRGAPGTAAPSQGCFFQSLQTPTGRHPHRLHGPAESHDGIEHRALVPAARATGW
jgi:hypothetical protein